MPKSSGNLSRGPQDFLIFCLVLRSEEVLVVDRKRWWFSDRKRLLLLLVVRSEEISVVLRSEVDSKASQSGPSEREAEDAPGTPLPGAAPRHTALAGSHHSPWLEIFRFGPYVSSFLLLTFVVRSLLLLTYFALKK